jgi:hypothetical protein
MHRREWLFIHLALKGLCRIEAEYEAAAAADCYGFVIALYQSLYSQAEANFGINSTVAAERPERTLPRQRQRQE